MSALGVAVVIPTYNRPDQLKWCLDAIVRGEREPDEIWVCDQTRDRAAREANERVCRAGGANHLHLRQANASAARNAGMRAAHSDLIAYTDDDCIVDRHWLGTLVQEYEAGSRSEEVAAVTGRVLPALDKRNNVPVSTRAGTERRLFRASDGGMERGEWAPWDAGNGPNLLAPRGTLQAIGGFDCHLGPGTPSRAAEDIDLFYRLARVGTIIYEPGAVVYHRGKTRSSRLRSRYAYGLGMGTMLRKHLREGDAAARPLLGLYIRHQLHSAIRNGYWGPPETAIVLSGLIRSFTGGGAAHSPSRQNKTSGSRAV